MNNQAPSPNPNRYGTDLTLCRPRIKPRLALSRGAMGAAEFPFRNCRASANQAGVNTRTLLLIPLLLSSCGKSPPSPQTKVAPLKTNEWSDTLFEDFLAKQTVGRFQLQQIQQALLVFDTATADVYYLAPAITNKWLKLPNPRHGPLLYDGPITPTNSSAQ